jgi:hypothetical protein
MCFGGIFDIFLYHLSQDQQALENSGARMACLVVPIEVRAALRLRQELLNPF